MRIKPKLFALLLFFNMSKADSQDLYNAYSLAKAIADYKPADQLEAKASELLGGILWYARNDIDSFQSIHETRRHIEKYYPILSVKLKDIANTLLEKIDLTKLEKKELEKEIKNLDIRGRIISMYDSIKKLDDVLPGLNQTYIRQKDSLKLLALRQAPWVSKDSAVISQDSIRLATNKKRTEYLLHEKKTQRNNTNLRLDQLAAATLTDDEWLALKKIYVKYKAEGQLIDDPERLMKNFGEQVQEQKTIAEEPARTTGGFSLPNQAQLIDAMAIYLVKRVKQESVLWFFETLRRNGKSYELVRTAFPNTYELLQGNEIYEAPKMGSLWRYAISKDFISMPENLLRSKWIKEKMANMNAHFVSSLLTAIRMARMIEQDYSYNDMIAVLYTEIPFADRNEKANLNTLITLLYSLNADFYRQSGKETRLLQVGDLVRMTDTEFEIMLSLIDMKYNHAIRKLIIKNESLYINNTACLNAVRKWLGGILMRVQQFDTRRKEMVKVAQTAKPEDNQFMYSNNTTWKFAKDLLEGLLFTDTVSNQMFRADHTTLNQSLGYMANIQEFFQMLERKNFAGSVSVLFDIVEGLARPDEVSISREKLQHILEEQKFKYYKEVLTTIKNVGTYSRNDSVVLDKFGFRLNDTRDIVIIKNISLLNYVLRSREQNAINTVLKLSGFLNDVAVTKNSKELSKVIEAYALPPGSYKMKRAVWRSFDINAYVGVYSGYEWNKKDTVLKKSKELQTGFVYGLTAPIGFSLSATLGRKIKKNTRAEKLANDYLDHSDRLRFSKNNIWTRGTTTLTAFFSIIDIGAVVSYRFSNNDSILPQKLKWEQVFSPGFHLNLGINGSPLVISAGYEYTPALRKLTVTGGRQLNMHRVHLGFLFDIPLFNIGYAADRNKYYSPKKLFK